MKGMIIILVIIGLISFAFLYGFILYKLDYGVMDYNKYYGVGEYNQTPCEAKHLENGWTQLENCAIYKINQIKFRKIIR